MRIFFKTFSTMLAASMLLGCQESDSPDSKPELSVDGTEYTMPAEGGSVSVKISSNCYWDVTAEDPDGKPVGWITTNLTKGSGSDVLEITAGANIKTERRVALVKVETPAEGVKGCEITVTQAAGEVALTSGYSFPICQTIDIDNPESRTLANAVITGNECQFKDGMILSCTGAEASTSLECPSHTQPTGGTDADRAIHRSIRFDNFAKGESILISVPVKDALSGDLRLMMGARAASFTKAGWSYYWSSDGEKWNQIDVQNATTPGSDAVWNNLYFTIKPEEAIPAGGTLHFSMTADAERSKTYVCISNAICIFPAEASKSTLPQMDDNKLAFTNGFDDLIKSEASYPELLPFNLMASATSGYASNYKSFNNQYLPDRAYEAISSASGCYERPGFLQVGYYDESLWTRQCIGTYKVLIGERLKQMGVSSADARLSLKVGLYKDARGYDPLAKVTVTVGEDTYPLETTIGTMKECTIDIKNLTQASVIAISTPKLTEEELAASGRGENAANLQDYRFYIDDIKLELTEVHSRGASGNGGNEDFNNGGSYKW